MLVIHNELLNKRPASLRGFKEVRLTGKLISVEESHDRFRLRPPMFVGVDDARWVSFIHQPTICIEAFIVDCLRHVHRNVSHLFQQCGIAENLRRFAQQPTAFDVVTE